MTVRSAYCDVPCARFFRLKLLFTYAAYCPCASSLSLTPAPSYLLPCLWLLFWTQDHCRAGLRPGNILWKFSLASFSKFCFGPGWSTLSPWSADVTSTCSTVSLFLSVFCFYGDCSHLDVCHVGFIGGALFFLVLPGITRHSLSLYYFIWFCIILCFLAYSHYYASL
jgi:hypothetical protein